MSLSPQELTEAVIYNESHAEIVGWKDFQLEIGLFFELVSPFRSEDFAQAVADWQASHSSLTTVNGQLEPTSWKYLKIELNWGHYLVVNGELISDIYANSNPSIEIKNWLDVDSQGNDLVFHHSNPKPWDNNARNILRHSNNIDTIILHETGGWGGDLKSAPSEEWRIGKIGAHFKISEKGIIVQYYDTARYLNHAGAFNSNSIGIEFTNPSDRGEFAEGRHLVSRYREERDFVTIFNGKLYMVPSITQMEGLHKLLSIISSAMNFDLDDPSLWKSYSQIENTFQLDTFEQSLINQLEGLPGIFAHSCINKQKWDGFFQNLCMFLVFVKALSLEDAYNLSKNLISTGKNVVNIPNFKELQGELRTVAVMNDVVFVGGRWAHSNILQKSTEYSFWTEVGGGVNGDVFTMAADGENLLVGGNFTGAGNSDINKIARWDGSTWHSVGLRMPDNFWVHKIIKTYSSFYVILTASFGHIGEYAKIWTLNNGAWQELPESGLARNSSINSIIDYGNTQIIGGRLRIGGGALGPTTGYMLAQWDLLEMKWKDFKGFGILPSNVINGVIHSILYANNSLFFAGTFANSDRHLVKVYDGLAISDNPGEFKGGIVRVLHRHKGQIYAGGDFNSVGENDSIKKIAKWNGYSWEAVVKGVGTISNVHDIVSTDSGIYIVGSNEGGSYPMVLFIED